MFSLQTESGSALHEAALFGKIEVVKLLLNYGIDTELEDLHRRTVMELLNDVNTSIAVLTKKLIRDHSVLVNTDADDSSTLMSDSSSHCISPPPGYTDNTPQHQSHHHQFYPKQNYSSFRKTDSQVSQFLNLI